MKMKKADPFCYEKPIPIILGCFVNGLGLIRSFGEENIPTIGLDITRNIGMYSKYTQGYICPNPSKREFIQYLINLGKKLKKKGVLFATYDDWLMAISKHQKELSEYYLFPMSGWDVIKKCVDKSLLYKIAIDNNIPIPKTIFLKTITDIKEVKNEISYPFILKPYTPTYYRNTKIGKHVLFIKNKSDLEFWTSRIKQFGLYEVPLICQEYIYGDAENLFTLTSYSNTDAKVVAYSIGHKIRQFPPESGVIRCGKLKNEPELFKIGCKLIKCLNFYGISNIEFKKDTEGHFRLMEVNARPGMWTYSSTASGLNLPYIAYEEILGNKFNGIERSDTGKIWLTLLDDLYSSLIEYKKAGYPHAQISFNQWLKSIKGKKIFGIISLTDPLPGLVHTWRKIS